MMTIREANEAERLLPCPFCGSQPKEVGRSYPGGNMLLNCGGEDCACMGDFTIAQWNRRSRPEPQAVSGETPCNHELWERETACADGYCPICLARRLREAEERGSKFQAAIEWALGQGDSDFEPRRPNDPPYYWRTKLRKLAFGSLTYNKETRTISTEAAERRPSVREAQEEVREACARLIEDFKTGGSDAETVTYWGKTLAEVIRSLDLSKVGGAR